MLNTSQNWNLVSSAYSINETIIISETIQDDRKIYCFLGIQKQILSPDKFRTVCKMHPW